MFFPYQAKPALASTLSFTYTTTYTTIEPYLKPPSCAEIPKPEVFGMQSPHD